MSQLQVEVEGTLRPDGTLLLDERPTLPPGRVLVTVRPLPQLPADDPFWQGMQAIWDSLKAAGHRPRTREQVEADLRELDDDAESEVQEVEGLHRATRQAREAAAHPEGPSS